MSHSGDSAGADPEWAAKVRRDPVTGRFLPGHSGRRKGTRNKLSELFWRDMVAAWQTQGRAAIEKTIESRPGEFLRIIAGLMPKDADVSDEKYHGLSDVDIKRKFLAALQEARSLGVDLGLGGAGSGAGEGEAGPAEPL